MKYLLHDLSWEAAKELARAGTVVVLPIGSTEQHGRHLPVEVDSRLAQEVARAATDLAGRQIDVILAPTLPFGASHHHIEFPGTLSLALSTYIRVLRELAASLIRNGFTHIFYLNGHGGNGDPMRIAMRLLRDRYPSAVVGGASYWELARQEIEARRLSSLGGMSHACELETALMMHVHPEVVQTDKIIKFIPQWRSEYLADDLLQGGRVSIAYHTSDVTSAGSLGDPTLATPERGADFFRAIVKRVGSVIVDFSQWQMDDLLRRE